MRNMNRWIPSPSLTVLVGLIGLAAHSLGFAQIPAGTAFSYQGRLTDGALAANGPYDLQFGLFDGSTGGTQIGAALEKGSVPVAKGLFTVELDFGDSAFNGDARWLEIGVRPGGSADPYTILSPRQKLNPTPYAMRAANSPGGTGGPGGFTGGIPEIIRSYPVAAGESIQQGDGVSIFNGEVTRGFPSDPADATTTLSGGQAAHFDMVTLSPTTFLVAYEDPADNDKGKARIVTLTDGPPSLGPAFTFNEGVTGSISVVRLTSDTIVICFVDHSESSQGTAVVGSISGDTLTFGSEYDFNVLSTTSFAPVALSSSKIAIAFVSSNTSLGCIVGDVASNLIAFGSAVFPAGLVLGNASAAALSSSLFVVAYVAAGGNEEYLLPCTVAGNVIASQGPALIGASDFKRFLLLAALDDTRLFLSFRKNPFSYSVVVTYAAGSFTFGPEAVQGFGYVADLELVSPTVVGLGIITSGAPTRSQAMFATIQGETITNSPATAFTETLLDNEESSLRVAPFSATKAALAFAATGPTMRISVVGVQFNGLTGIAQGGASGGQTIAVKIVPPFPLRGISSVQNGLLAGNYYYMLPGGSLTELTTTKPLGRAISATEIIFVDP